MKTWLVFAALLGGVLILACTAVAGHRAFDPPTLDRIERSLAMAFESNSPGMQATAALTLRQVKAVVPDYTFERCVIPLMRIVKGESYDPNARVCAAIALHELGSGRGDFAIRRTAEFTECPRLRHTCAWLTHYRALGN